MHELREKGYCYGAAVCRFSDELIKLGINFKIKNKRLVLDLFYFKVFGNKRDMVQNRWRLFENFAAPNLSFNMSSGPVFKSNIALLQTGNQAVSQIIVHILLNRILRLVLNFSQNLHLSPCYDLSFIVRKLLSSLGQSNSLCSTGLS